MNVGESVREGVDAASEVGGRGEAGLLEVGGGLGAAWAERADGDDAVVAREAAGGVRELAGGDGGGGVGEGGEGGFPWFADVKDGDIRLLENSVEIGWADWCGCWRELAGRGGVCWLVEGG